jgi:TetR/AcrR family transcriptional repressor of nem operon
MAAYRERMLPWIPGRNVEEKRARAFILLTGMAGVLVAARAIVDAESRERTLAAAQLFYLETFARD